MDVRTRILTIRLLEKMQEPDMEKYSRNIGIINTSHFADDSECKHLEVSRTERRFL